MISNLAHIVIKRDIVANVLQNIRNASKRWVWKVVIS